MSAFTSLLSLSEQQLAGSFHTAREIGQQPRVWGDVLTLLEKNAHALDAFLRAPHAIRSGDAMVLLVGAGSSDFVGRSVAGILQRRLARQVIAAASTHLVTHPGSRLVPGRQFLAVHFARSGDSPESLEAYRALKRMRPNSTHLVITCNHDGALAAVARSDPSAMVLVLPPETNDRSLAMTSSFSSMALAAVGLGWISDLPGLRGAFGAVRAGAMRVMDEYGDMLAGFASSSFDRACYLGSDALAGAMHEAALKMLEMSAGAVITVCDSFLGIRHGPQVFINDHCAVVACLSSDRSVRRYEMDLLAELRSKGQGCGILAISANDDPGLRDITPNVVVLSPSGAAIDGSLRVFTDIVACQIFAFNTSRARGLMPDNPSPLGVINRVVRGVTIYDPLFPTDG